MLLALVASLALPARGAAEVTFHLVPQEAWNDGSPASEDWLPAGTITLYRQGSYTPERTVPLLEPVRIPAGTWAWIGEAPGYVTAAGGTLTVSEEAAAGALVRKNVLWPALPACELVLAGDWRGVERLDVASLNAGAVYPVSPPSATRRLQVPAGSWIAYGVRGGSVTGLGPPTRCRQAERVELPPPAPPPADRQDAVIHARLPDSPEADPGGVRGAAFATSRPRPPTKAVASFRSSRHVTYFFRHLPAEEPLEIRLQHPALRTVTHPLSPLGGSVREATFDLALRPSVELEIDYRPRRVHRRQDLVVLSCEGARFAPDDCTAVSTQPLTEGFARYEVPRLDDGPYLFAARIGDEWLHGLGRDLWVEVTASSPPVLRPPPLRLEEKEVWGHLLEDEREVPGEVVLVPRSNGFPLRRAPTAEEDLVYHLYYFGRAPNDFQRRLLPDDLAERDGEELLGLYDWYEIQACSESGHCRSLPLRSFLIGSGRLDLDLGGSRGLEIAVVDAASGEPLPRLPVLVRGSEEARLVFHDGEARWLPKEGGEAAPRRTADDGVARVRDLDPGPVRWAVKAPGYEPASGEASVPSEGWTTVEVALIPNDGPADAELRFPDGEPLAGGAVLVFGPDGGRRPRCGGALSASGGLRLRTGCAPAARLAVLHPRARLTVLDGETLESIGRAVVERAPAPPIRVRITDATGRALPGVPVFVRIDGLELGPDDLASTLTHFVVPPFHSTDSDGLVELGGIDPGAPAPPEVSVRWNGERVDVPLAGARPGETVELRVEAVSERTGRTR